MSKSSAVQEVRINARLTGADAALFLELQRQQGGRSASDLLRDALRAYHAARTRPASGALAALTEAGYVGCGDAPADLSTHYKRYLDEALGEKHPALRVQEPGPNAT